MTLADARPGSPDGACTSDAEVANPVAPSDEAGAIAAIHKHCAVFTRREVACAILDFAGWRADRDLAGERMLEPACGEGAFLLPAIARLVTSARAFGRPVDDSLADQILAFEFDAVTAAILRAKVLDLLGTLSVDAELAGRLASAWLRCDDFLAADGVGAFSLVIGNPPYMRWSKLPKVLRTRYEAALPVHSARGDLCLSFVWKGATCLRPTDGRLVYLCADRWLRCAYGDDARLALAGKVRVANHFDVHRLAVFDGERKVGAYAGVTLLDQAKDLGGEVESFANLPALLARLQAKADPAKVGAHLPRVLHGGGGAVLAGGALRSLFDALCATTVRLPEAGIEVRCGMALGAAGAFVVAEGSGLEPSRLVPYVRARDVGEDGKVGTTRYVIDVWEGDGDLIDLDAFPKLKAHLERHRTALEARACVGRPEQWYRTIDRLRRERLAEPRVLVAGMAKRSRVGWLPPGMQPGNALYALTSRDWPLRLVYSLLRTGLLDVFAAVLAPRFSGGSLRFDGNVLNQVRIPPWSSLDKGSRRKLIEMAEGDMMSAATVADLYRLTNAADIETLNGFLAVPAGGAAR